MGNEYNRFHHHQNLHLHSRNTFLPMLCSKPSIKDVTIPKWKNHSVSFSDDPLSPRIGCMGQVKRNNKVVGYPTSHKLTLTPKSNNTTTTVKYSKLKKLFSSKNLAAVTAATTTTTTTGSCRSRREVAVNGASVAKSTSENCVSISIIDLDPPLPVIKKVQKPVEGGESESDNLWKRRSGGVALKGLQLQQIHHSRHYLQPTTV